jgi:hypothetical protein
MPIPTQNEFLLPFLQALGDGQSYPRSQLMFRLARQFDLSEDEIQAMSGSQFTLVSRIAWCDAHFCKAGFVQKTQHPHDSMQDTFQITSLGVRELNRHPERLTVGYLMSFYRGKVYRGAGADDTTSDAELLLAEKFESLPDAFTVLHSVKWFAKARGTIGEADFVVAHPEYGVLVVEVKGGQISVERGNNRAEWYSTGLSGRTVPIKDPCEQADRNRWALRDWLGADPRTSGYSYAIFPAVALPDSRVERDVRPDCPADIFIDLTHLDDLEARLLAIYRYWQVHAGQVDRRMGGRAAVDALLDLLVPTRTLRPRIAEVFERERRKIDELTQQQFTVLKLLRRYKRAAIVGGAGSGKTMLAMEKAQQLAEAGYRVLFLCYNRSLADWLYKTVGSENIFVCTYHALIGITRGWAGITYGSNLSWDELSERAPDLLLDAASIIRAPGSGAEDKLFDAVIVDEAQDFEEHWWISLPEVLSDPQNGVIYLFFDDNQRLYSDLGSVPMEQPPFFLTENCRNTQHIHAALTPYAHTTEDVECNGPEGRPIEMIPAPTPSAAKQELQRVLHRLVNEEQIPLNDIIVLTPSSEKRSHWKPDQILGNFVLTWDTASDMRHAVRVSTIYRFKGLESAVVILTELEQAREEIRDQLLYVGLSRARHHVVVIGSLPSSSTVLRSSPV